MAKIILNQNYVDSGDIKQLGKYLFDAEDGSALVTLSVWLEKSKATDKHPDGKPWILLPKNNVTNRQYFSEDLFIATAVDGIATVEIKTAAPRVLGTTGVKQEVLKYLDEETATEYTNLVELAIEAFKAAKESVKKKKVEDMNVEELTAYLDALKVGRTPVTAAGPRSFLDMFNDEQYTRYNEILAIATENKANAPKATRKPLTEKEKAVRAEKRKQTEITKAEALLAALRAKTTDFGHEEIPGDADYEG